MAILIDNENKKGQNVNTLYPCHINCLSYLLKFVIISININSDNLKSQKLEFKFSYKLLQVNS